MKYLLSKNSKSLEPIGNFKLNKAIASLTKYFKKLVALSLLATLALATGACDGKKTSAQKAKTQLETLGIDANKAFFVTPSGKKTNDGSSWQKSMDLQTAIDAAATDTNKKFVLVAEGSYYADPNKTDITKSFILKDKVKIYGGFDMNAKKLTRYKDASILEGKLKAKEGANAAIHSKRILTGTNLSATSILDGFLIQNALYAGSNATGGGLLLNNSKPELNNLTFNNNKLTGNGSYGGAIYNYNNSSPSISNSTFNNNKLTGNNSYGGAIYNWRSSPSISNATFSNNSATSSGGAISNYNNSSPNISNASFSNNSAEWGAAIDNNNSSPSISNATFSNNSAAKWGGAIFNYNKSIPKTYNSILWDNKDKHKGTEVINNIYNYDGASQLIIKNSILNANSIGGHNTNIDISAGAGKGNNQTPTTFSIDVRGKVASANQALIKDKGDNALYKEVTKKEASSDKDLAGNPRLKGSKIDIGAYEIQD